MRSFNSIFREKALIVHNISNSNIDKRRVFKENQTRTTSCILHFNILRAVYTNKMPWKKMLSIFRENTFWSLTFQHLKDYKEFLEKMTADNFLHFAFKHFKGSLHC